MIAFVVATGHHHTMTSPGMDPARSRDRLRSALHHDVSDWLRARLRTPYPLAWKTADRVVATELADPEVAVVYLTAADLLRYRDQTLAEVDRMAARECVRGS